MKKTKSFRDKRSNKNTENLVVTPKLNVLQPPEANNFMHSVSNEDYKRV